MIAAVKTWPVGTVSRAALSKRLFQFALLISTIVPFFAGAAAVFFPGLHIGLIDAIVFLATIHVPLTIYLLFDGQIRRIMARRPLIFLGVPSLIFLGLAIVACLQWSQALAGQSIVLATLLLAIYSWQMYHFGKQNIGVYAFTRSTEGRGPMPLMEKRLILAAAWVGVLASYYANGPTSIVHYAQNADLSFITRPLDFLGSVGGVAQSILSLVSIAYLVKNRRRVTFASGVMFLLSVNFFFPQFLLAGKLPLGSIFALYILSHGLQYVVFLAFHAMNFPVESATGQKSLLPRLAMILIFVGCLYFTGDLYFYHRFISPDIIADGISALLFHSVQYSRPLDFAVIFTILLNHFWLDSFFWRGSDPSARAWMGSRFAFVLKS